jgi:signal transduction histidine kinase
MTSLAGFMPHGMCYLWRLDILLMHVVSDLVIGLAYFSIPLVLWIFSSRRPDLMYRPIAYLFIAFILFCGATHFMSIYTVWVPVYFVEGLLKIGTAAASLATAIALWPLLPRAFAIPSVQQLETTNASLRAEVDRRTAAEVKLTDLAENLEHTVEARTEALAKTNATLRDFAAGASHDLKAPARQVALLSDLALRDEDNVLSEKSERYLQDIRTKSVDMLDLVDTLLNYSALVDAEPERVELALAPLVKQVAAGLPAFAGRSLSVTVTGNSVLRADETLVTQLFKNLFENSLKYSDKDDPSVEVKICAHRESVEIVITDNGPGIPPGQAEGVFNMLQRYRTDVPGSGVGLAFCRRIMDAHAGSIRVNSEFEGGAFFILSFPTGKAGAS